MISGCVCDLIKNPNHHQERDLLAFPRKLTPALTPSSQSAIALPPARSCRVFAVGTPYAGVICRQAAHGADRLHLPGAAARRFVVGPYLFLLFKKKHRLSHKIHRQSIR
jgi:hypothetical protein